MADYYVKTTGNDTTGDGSEGNPYATPGKAAGVGTTSGDVIYLQSGTYTLTSSTANVAGGRVSLSVGVRMEGYATTGGDMGAPPVIDAGAITGVTIVTLAGGENVRQAACVNVVADGNSGAGNVGFDVQATYSRVVYRCVARDCPSYGFVGDTIYGTAALCLAISCGVGFYRVKTYGCGAILCTSHGFEQAGGSPCPWVRSIAAGNGGTGFRCVYPGVVIECTAHANDSHGFAADYDDGMIFASCVATDNGAYGVGGGASNWTPTVFGAAFHSNTSGSWQNTPSLQFNEITLSADPYANAAGYSSAATIDDLFACFEPNSTAGGGALLRAASFPQYLDVGAVQHQAAGGGGSSGGFVIGA